MPVTQILSVVGRSAGGGGGPVAADIYFDSDTGLWTGYGGSLGTSAGTLSYQAYTYPDTSSGNVYNFTGNESLFSPNLGNANAWTANGGTIVVDMWFYPTVNSIQVLSETNQQAIAGYYYTVLEINSSGNVLARFYNGATATSDNTVTLNQWNHVYWAADSQGGHYFDVNGVTTNTGLYYTRSSPGNTTEFFNIGDYNPTNMGNTGRFQGKIGVINIHDSIVASTYSATKSKYSPYLAEFVSGVDYNASTSNLLYMGPIQWTNPPTWNPAYAGKTIEFTLSGGTYTAVVGSSDLYNLSTPTTIPIFTNQVPLSARILR